MKGGVTGLLAFAALLAVPAGGRTPVPAPDRWKVDWGGSRCTLFREGLDPRSPGLAISRVPGTDYVELRLANPPGPLGSITPLTPVEVELTSPGREPRKAAFQAYRERSGSMAAFGRASAFLEDLAGADSISIRPQGKGGLDLKLPGVVRAVSATRQCEDSLLRAWGFEPAAIATLQSQPKQIGDAGEWVQQSDYPRGALRANASGTAVARLKVTRDGRVSACGIVSSSGRTDLDAASCDILKRRGRYEPAIDAAGNPADAVVVLMVSWSR